MVPIQTGFLAYEAEQFPKLEDDWVDDIDLEAGSVGQGGSGEDGEGGSCPSMELMEDSEDEVLSSGPAGMVG